ncbi:MAG: non-homologous end-joining DNA ligase [Gemmatimonadales bacterium]
MKEGGELIAGVRLTNPDRVLYPEQGVTKRDLAEYYQKMAGWILPHLLGRPLSLVRCPRGREGDCFYQKHVTDALPDVIHGVEIEEEKGTGIYITIRDISGVIALVQFGVLEIHPWGAREDRIERPDRLVLDLDPGPGVEWAALRSAAEEVRQVVEHVGLTCFLRTTGGKGLHVVAPVDRRIAWEDLKAFAQDIAQGMAKARPESYIATASKARREGLIYVDYLRNSRGATAIASYSTRALPGAPVATPLSWGELDDLKDPAEFTVATTPGRMAALKNEPWNGFFEVRQSITRAMRSRIGKHLP